MKLYDVIIIGGGPAGYSAALYAARNARSVLVIEKLSAGGQMATTCLLYTSIQHVAVLIQPFV